MSQEDSIIWIFPIWSECVQFRAPSRYFNPATYLTYLITYTCRWVAKQYSVFVYYPFAINPNFGVELSITFTSQHSKAYHKLKKSASILLQYLSVYILLQGKFNTGWLDGHIHVLCLEYRCLLFFQQAFSTSHSSLQPWYTVSWQSPVQLLSFSRLTKVSYMLS